MRHHSFKFTVLGHNTIRGAAGASILNAELLKDSSDEVRVSAAADQSAEGDVVPGHASPETGPAEPIAKKAAEGPPAESRAGGQQETQAEGQLLALRRAYRRAGFGVEAVTYFEGHGPGITLGQTDRRQQGGISHPASVPQLRGTPPAPLRRRHCDQDGAIVAS